MAGNIAKRSNGNWRARYRDEADNERARHFDRKIDAQRWLDETSASVLTGTYADPQAGKVTFAAFFGEWSARQVWARGTVLAMSLGGPPRAVLGGEPGGVQQTRVVAHHGRVQKVLLTTHYDAAVQSAGGLRMAAGDGVPGGSCRSSSPARRRAYGASICLGGRYAR